MLFRSDTISDKNALIKSLEDDCNRKFAKSYDSIKQEVAITISEITKPNNNHNAGQDTAKKTIITKSINELDKKFKQIKTDFQKEKIRLFIQYNYPGDIDKINRLIATLKNKSDYLVTPPEFINRKFDYRIKCFNYEDARKEFWLMKLTQDALSLDTTKIKIRHETKDGMSPTIEIWLGSPYFQPVQQQLIQNKVNDKKF